MAEYVFDVIMCLNIIVEDPEINQDLPKRKGKRFYVSQTLLPIKDIVTKYLIVNYHFIFRKVCQGEHST